MLARRITLALVLLLGLLTGHEVHAQGGGGGAYIRGQLGYAWPSLKDVNAEIRLEEDAIRPISTLTDWEELAGGARYSAEVGYEFTSVFSMGLEFGYQKSARDHLATILFDNGGVLVNGRVDQKVEASLFTVMLTPTIRPPSTAGFHFGAQLGLGRGSYDRTESDNLGASDGSFLVGTLKEEFDETAFVGGLFAGFDIPVSPDMAFSMRAGYLLSSFSSMDGPYAASGTTEVGPFEDSGHAALLDSSGNRLEVSFSGVNLSAGFRFRFSSGD